MENKECQHKWVYEPLALASNPPQQRRACEYCGRVETVVVGEPEDHVEQQRRFDKAASK